MADSFSTRLRQRLQQTGGNRNTWGSNLNAAALQLLEDAVCGLVPVTVAGTDVTLSVANGAQDQARMAIINLVGAPGATRNIIVPAVSKFYLIINDTGFAQTVKPTGAGATGVTVPAGALQYLVCDGTNIRGVQANALGTVANADALGGFAAALYARLNNYNQFTAGFATTFSTLVDGGSVALDCTLSNRFYLTIGGNRTLVINNPHDGQSIEIWIKQDATGGRTLAWPGNVEFDSGTSSALSGTANAIDRFELTYRTASNLWKATSRLGAATADLSLSLTRNEQDIDVFARAGSPSGIVSLTVTVAAGVVIGASSTRVAAMDFSGGFIAGSTITLVNNGYILGHGGDGNDGALVAVEFTGPGVIIRNKARNGLPGGPAIIGPGVDPTFNINNTNGFIWGGGGGGGGGGANADSSSGDMGAGGGGGGGAGNGRPGSAATAGHHTEPTILGTDGNQGSSGTHGTFGAGGAGDQNGSATGGTAGDGGDWGAAGVAGASPVGKDRNEAGGTAGAAGKAVDQNGGTANFTGGASAPHVKGAVA